MDPGDFFGAYPFEPDPFQLEAVTWLSKGYSVLVSAPTGSGKTVVAEYAIARALAENSKVFYTTPLKALSNQKFRDFRSAYPPEFVGLLTGDNSINGEALVVVMTTEVLRNMIYEGSELLYGLSHVVLDEIHYMDDPFRGQTWEEIIIQLPRRVKIVGLSATISNAVELGNWMDSLRKDVRVVLSEKRPVELKNHYFVGKKLVPLFSKDIMKVIDRELESLKKTRQAMAKGKHERLTDLRPRRTEVVKELKRRDMLPAIYFLFSRAACDEAVRECLDYGVKLVTAEEENRIGGYVEDKIRLFDPAELEHLGYSLFLKGLKAGLASHHAGEIPLFKEVIEELFSMGLIRVVFATETLSLGINMPARSVVIESLTKWTGEGHRPLTPGEYRQLTGRAGRRSIDREGHAVVLYQRFFSIDQIRLLASKPPDPVVSSFQVTYNMTVNLLSRYGREEAEKMINRSFAQYLVDRRVIDLQSRLDSIEREMLFVSEGAKCGEGVSALKYAELEGEISRLSRKLASMRRERRKAEINEVLASLKPGDVFLTGQKGSGRVLAVAGRPALKGGEYSVLAVDDKGRYRRVGLRSMKQPPRIIGAIDVETLSSSSKRLRRSVGERMEALVRASGNFGRQPSATGEEAVLIEAVRALREDFESYPCHKCQHRERCLEAARKMQKLESRKTGLQKEMQSGHGALSKSLSNVISILNKFGFMSGESITEKGELLRRIYNECDLLVVESITGGVMENLSPEEISAFASWFIYESKEDDLARRKKSDEFILRAPEGLLRVFEWLEGRYAEIKKEEASKGLDLLGVMDTGFAEAAYAWSSGAELDELFRLNPEHSAGDIVRILKQLIDLLRQIESVSESQTLRGKLRAAMDRLDRGVVGYSSFESIIEHGLW